MRLALVLLLTVGCGSAVEIAQVPAPPVDPLDGVWAEVFGRSDARPDIDWRQGDCGNPEAPGFSVRDESVRTTLCLGGQALSEGHIWVATWPGATLSDRALALRVAHEFTHVHIMRLGVFDGDYGHDGPEWLPGDLVDRAIDYLVAQSYPLVTSTK